MSLPPGLQSWALPQIEFLLPLDHESLTQIIRTAATSEGGAEGAGRYLRGLLGESPDSITFIAEFTSRIARSAGAGAGAGAASGSGLNTPTTRSRPITPIPPRASTPPPPQWSISGSAPLAKRNMHGGSGLGRGGKKGDMGYTKELRRPEEVAEMAGLKAYRKGGDESNFMGGGEKKRGDSAGGGAESTVAENSNNTNTTTAVAAAARGQGQQKQQKQQKLQGTLTSDLLAPKASKPTKSTNTSTSASSTSNTNNKIHLTATPSSLRAPASNLSDLEAALRALELTTNPTLANPQKKTICNCQATRHDLLLAAPNCLSCGKIICIKEGPGPCTFCGTPLLTSEETQEMIAFLREERGREKMAADKRANKKAEVSRTPKLYSQGNTAAPPQLGAGYGTPMGEEDDDAAALKRAREHRDKLLSFQASNAQRTKIIDEAADFDTSAITSAGYAGLNQWATPEERALQLKKQQKRMRELQWAAKEDWEKRKVVVSIDISGKNVGGSGGDKGKGKRVVVTRREMRSVEMNEGEMSEQDEIEDIRAYAAGEEVGEAGSVGEGESGSGRYARNPLLKGLIRPVFTPPTPASSTSTSHKPTPLADKGKGKPTPSQSKDNTTRTYTGPEADDDYDYDHDYNGDNYEEYDLPEVVKTKMRNVRSLAKGGGWKRVLQDEQEVKDNERWILDGVRGGGDEGRGREEPGCG